MNLEIQFFWRSKNLPPSYIEHLFGELDAKQMNCQIKHLSLYRTMMMLIYNGYFLQTYKMPLNLEAKQIVAACQCMAGQQFIIS